MPYRVFLVVYLVVAIPAAVFVAFPAILLIVLLFTFGLAFPLALLPAVAVYLTALWPAVLVWRDGHRALAAMIAAAALAITAIAPGLLAAVLAKSEAAAILAGDVEGRLPSAPRAIEIETAASFSGGSDEPLRKAPCNETCQTLLLGRDVDAVRIRTVTGGRRAKVQTIVYSYEERPACPKAFADAKTALPATQVAAAHGRCLVPTINGDWTPVVRLVIAKQRKGWKSRAPLLYTDGDRTRYELQVAEGASWRVVSRATELRTKALMIPLVLGFPNSYGLELRSGWERTTLVFGATDAAAILRASAGYRVALPEPPPPEPIHKTIDRILSAGGDEPLGPELMAVINHHLDTLRGQQRELSPQDVALLQRLLANKRVVDHFHVSEALRRHPEVAAPVIGDILDRLEKPVSEAHGHNHSHLAWIVARAPIESVRPYGQRILKIADMSDQWHLAPLLRIAGRLDVDGSDLLRRRLKAASRSVREAAVVGVCAADQPWATALAPAVEGILDYYRGKRWGGNGDLIVALKIMKRNERDAEVEAFLRTLPENDARRIKARLARRPRTDAGPDCST